MRQFLTGLLAFFSAIPSAAAADQALIDAAKKEGEVVWYTTQIVDQFVRPAIAAFEGKYGIKVDYVRSGISDMVLRVINEAKAGHAEGDVVDGTSTSATLKRENLALKWVPENRLPSQFVDPQGYWIATNLYVLTPGFNTALVPEGTEPRTPRDLLDPKWKNKMAWPIPPAAGLAPEYVGMMLEDMGEEKGLAFLHALAAQNITGLAESARQVLDEVIAGEYPLALQIFDNHAVISAAKGAPVDWIPMSPALGVLSVASITRLAPHPNAAKLFLEFLVSEEGQKIMGASGELPVHPDVPPGEPGLRPDGVKFRAVYFTPEQLDQRLPKWTEIFNDIFR
ncbi:MAG TPA: extracellular solute-binding protein [Beijerinckiaceae bacterium]|nr:extracellular solute-binding protein [Beijerinckiaceae bacterium]